MTRRTWIITSLTVLLTTAVIVSSAPVGRSAAEAAPQSPSPVLGAPATHADLLAERTALVAARVTRSKTRPRPPAPRPKPVVAQKAPQTPRSAPQSSQAPAPVSQGFLAWVRSWTARVVVSCESHGNPRAVNPGWTTFGMWQFDIGTWLSNGGGQYAPRADLAPADDQNRVAYVTWTRRGWEPWISDWIDGCVAHGGW